MLAPALTHQPRAPPLAQARPVVARVAAQEAVTVSSNGLAPEPTNMMDLEELTDIIRCAPRPSALAAGSGVLLCLHILDPAAAVP